MREQIIAQIVKIFTLGGLSTVLSFMFAPLLLKFLLKNKVCKQIRQDANAPIFTRIHEKKGGTPTMGGIIFWFITFFIALSILILSFIFGGIWTFLNFVTREQTILILGSMMLAALVGIVDDIFNIYRIGPKGGGLPMSVRLLLHTFIASIGAWWFYVKLEWDILYVPFVGTVHLGFWYIPFFIFIIVGTAFALNETDGLDGLAGGISFMALIPYIAIAFLLGRFDLASLLAVVMGGVLAFLWFNINPAKFFMGDTGSMTLGVLFGFLAMYTNTALFLPLFLFIPFIEALSVIVQTFSKKFLKRKIFPSTPIHHTFEANGWPETKVTMTFWLIQGMAMIFGLLIYLLSVLKI